MNFLPGSKQRRKFVSLFAAAAASWRTGGTVREGNYLAEVHPRYRNSWGRNGTPRDFPVWLFMRASTAPASPSQDGEARWCRRWWFLVLGNFHPTANLCNIVWLPAKRPDNEVDFSSEIWRDLWRFPRARYNRRFHPRAREIVSGLYLIKMPPPSSCSG